MCAVHTHSPGWGLWISFFFLKAKLLFHLPHLKTIKFFWYFLNGYFLEHTPQPTTISKSGVVRMLLHSCSARKILVMTAPPLSLFAQSQNRGSSRSSSTHTPSSPHFILDMASYEKYDSILIGWGLPPIALSFWNYGFLLSPRVVVITQAHIFISRCVRWKEGKESNVLWSYEYDRLGITTTATRERGESYALSGPQDRSLREREKVTFSYF